jgi:hypothetical protein
MTILEQTVGMDFEVGTSMDDFSIDLDDVFDIPLNSHLPTLNSSSF